MVLFCALIYLLFLLVHVVMFGDALPRHVFCLEIGLSAGSPLCRFVPNSIDSDQDSMIPVV